MAATDGAFARAGVREEAELRLLPLLFSLALEKGLGTCFSLRFGSDAPCKDRARRLLVCDLSNSLSLFSL